MISGRESRPSSAAGAALDKINSGRVDDRILPDGLAIVVVVATATGRRRRVVLSVAAAERAARRAAARGADAELILVRLAPVSAVVA